MLKSRPMFANPVPLAIRTSCNWKIMRLVRKLCMPRWIRQPVTFHELRSNNNYPLLAIGRTQALLNVASVSNNCQLMSVPLPKTACAPASAGRLLPEL